MLETLWRVGVDPSKLGTGGREGVTREGALIMCFQGPKCPPSNCPVTVIAKIIAPEKVLFF